MVSSWQNVKEKCRQKASRSTQENAFCLMCIWCVRIFSSAHVLPTITLSPLAVTQLASRNHFGTDFLVLQIQATVQRTMSCQDQSFRRNLQMIYIYIYDFKCGSRVTSIHCLGTVALRYSQTVRLVNSDNTLLLIWTDCLNWSRMKHSLTCSVIIELDILGAFFSPGACRSICRSAFANPASPTSIAESSQGHERSMRKN